MPDRQVHVSLETTDAPASVTTGVFHEFTAAQRFRRAGALFLLGVLFAALIAPIPVVHLIGIPLMLLLGIALGVRQFTFAGRLAAVTLPCPKCGAPNRVGGGLGRRSTEPVTRACDSCRRILTLRIDPVTPSQ